MPARSKMTISIWLAAGFSLGITGLADAATYVPPVYKGTGPYRRVYADTGYAYMSAEVYLPSAPAIRTTGSDTPYVYTGGWGANGDNATDAGFQYSPTYNDWSLFISVSGVGGYLGYNGPRLEAGQAVSLQFDAVSNGSTATLQVFATGVDVYGETVTQSLSVADVPNWANAANDTLKRMTSIAEANGDNFTDGSFIDGVHWYDTTIGTSAASAQTWLGAETGGYQSYTSSVVSVQYVSATEETDSITLAAPEPTALPLLGLMLAGSARRRPRA